QKQAKDNVNGGKKIQQKLLDFEVTKRPEEFTKEAILEAVVKFITCENQALLTANKATFRNCLVAMRPKVNKNDLPSAHDVRVFIQNSFVSHIDQVRKEIEVRLIFGGYRDYHDCD
ncbi:hypothetical protein JOM56_014154, partial [Amanita muscaria]